MFLVLQHPFADSRGLLGVQSGRLLRPDWPLAAPERDFIRSSGLVRPRKRGGVDEWAGEELYGDAKLALRFPNHLSFAHLGTGNVSGVVDRAFRRFHSEGTVSRLDVGFRIRVAASAFSAASREWLTLFRDALEIPIRVNDLTGTSHTVKLIDAGDLLAQHYLNATTERKQNAQVNPDKWWLCAGAPALIVEYTKSNPVQLPPHSRQVLNIPDANATLWHAWLQIGKRRCSTWFIECAQIGNADAVRRLRIHLSRLHAERQCLELVLSHLKDGSKFNLEKWPGRSDAIQQYLKDAVQAIERPRRFGVVQSAMLESARSAHGIALEGHAASLQLMRRQIAARIEGYIRRQQSKATVIINVQGDMVNTKIQLGDVSVTGDFNLVTAANIQNSFNKAAASGVNDDLKDKLKALTVEVAKLAKKLPSDDAERVSKDLEMLTSEAVSKKPRKDWYDLSAKGLVEAAQTVADMAAPITTAVKAVLALLAL